MQRLLFGCVVFLLLSIPAFGQANEFRRFEIDFNFIGYARQGPQNFAAGDLAFAFHATKRLAIVADVGIHVAGDDALSEEWTTYRFGPRISYRHGSRITTFAHVLAGGARATLQSCTCSGPTKTSTSTSTDGFSFAAGGGVDVGIRPWFGFRVVQADYSFIRFGSADLNSNGFRVSSGIVFRFGKSDR
jgi:hypothetical protein